MKYSGYGTKCPRCPNLVRKITSFVPNEGLRQLIPIVRGIQSYYSRIQESNNQSSSASSSVSLDEIRLQLSSLPPALLALENPYMHIGPSKHQTSGCLQNVSFSQIERLFSNNKQVPCSAAGCDKRVQSQARMVSNEALGQLIHIVRAFKSYIESP